MLAVLLAVLIVGACDGGAASPDAASMGGEPPPPSGDAVELEFPEPRTQAPALAPVIVSLSYVGGAGDQYVRSVGFADDGSIVARGAAFTVRYDARGEAGVLEGDAALVDDARFESKPVLPGNPGRTYTDPRHDLLYTVGFRQAGGNLQIPIFRAFANEERIWQLWGHAVADVESANLGADSRCYQAWAMPEGRVGVQCWTDGGNSVLAKDPRDLGAEPSWNGDSFQRSAGGMSSLYALIDPTAGGSVISGTFVASHVAPLAVDAWGRVYLARVASSRSGGGEPANPYGQHPDATSGLLVLEPSLAKVLLNARIGGDCRGEGVTQAFGSIAIRGNMLVAGGTTCATDLVVENAVQSGAGGGQDGMILVMRLWDDNATSQARF